MERIFVGCALSDVNRADVPGGLRVPERLDVYVRRFQESVGTNEFSLELEPEDHWTMPASFPDEFVERKTNRWWRAFRQNSHLSELFRNAAGPIGVHQPVLGRDALSSNFFLKYENIAETQQAMAFAQFIGANYFVFHLVMTDRWGWDRRDQIAKALKIFRAYAAYYHASEFTFVPCIELLEYPQFPATGGEALEVLSRCREIWPATQLAFDISHLWGSRDRMMAAGLWEFKRGVPVHFLDVLEYGLEQTGNDVHVFHLGGCWESELHAIPGLHPQQDPFRYPIKLRERPSVYAEMGEIDLNRTLDLLLAHTVRKERPLRLILQIFDRDLDQVLEATRQIRDELIGRSAQPQPAEPRTDVAPRPARTRLPRKKTAAAKPKRKPKSHVRAS